MSLYVCVSAQSCPTLCDPMNCSPPGSSVHGILQARILEWVAISSSTASSWPRIEPVSSALAGRISITEPPGKPHAFVYLMHLPLYSAQNCYLENAVCQHTKRNHYGTYLESLIRLPSCSGLPFPSPDLPDWGIEPRYPALQTDSSPTEIWRKKPMLPQ